MTKEQIKKIERARKLLEECLLIDASIISELDIETPKVAKKLNSIVVDNYSGPTGGVKFLVKEKKFFKTQKNLAAVRMELSNNDYHYSRQAIHESLKTLSKPSGPLVSLKQGKNKVYVERK